MTFERNIVITDGQPIFVPARRIATRSTSRSLAI